MKLIKILCLLAFLILISEAQAKNYYFSSSSGNDSYSSAQAQNSATPWKTLNKLNSFMGSLSPGDSILFKSGDIFEGSIVVTKSGLSGQPIVFSSYGGSSKPIITGLSKLTNWVSVGNGIWESNCSSCASNLNVVILNDAPQAMGRYPNSNATNKGYLTITSNVSGKSVTSSQLSSSHNWAGGEVVIRTNRWVLDRNKITNHSGTTINYEAVTPYYKAENNFGFFIQNHEGTLDTYGEWYYDPASKKLKVFFGSNNPSSLAIQASTVNDLVISTNISHLVFDNLAFKGSNNYGFKIYGGQNININNSEISFSGLDGVNASHTSGIKVTNSIISNSLNGGLFLYPSVTGSTVQNNTIQNTATLAGMGGSGDLKYIGILIQGSNNLIEYNQVKNTGYTGIYFYGGSNNIVKNNLVDKYCFVKDDGSGIYTWNNPSNPTTYTGQKITGNIVLNGVSAPEGVANPERFLAAPGIYIDDNSSNIEIANNTVARAHGAGLFNHNAYNLEIKGNTFYNNVGAQIELSHDATNRPAIRNTNLSGNIFFAKTYKQNVALYKSVGDDINLFGTFDNNFYCRPFDDSHVVSTSFVQSGKGIWQAYELESWKQALKKDNASKGSPVKLKAYTINRLVGTNKFSNGTFNSNMAGVSAWAQSGNLVASWNSSGKLDGGALQAAFQSVSSTTNPAYLTLPIGAVSADKNYIVKFSLLGSKPNGTVAVYLRKFDSPWNNLSYTKHATISTTRSENEILFSFPSTENNAALILELRDQDGTVWFDNIQVVEADVTIANPDNHIRFEYNSGKTSKTVSLDGSYLDAKGNVYAKSINLAPFTSAVLIKQSDEANTEPVKNQPPAANAGPDQNITLPTSSVVLQGSGDDPEDKTNVTYLWSQVSGPNSATFNSKTVAKPTISGLVAGKYMFSLIVNDTQQASSIPDTVAITVNQQESPQITNQPPTANAGVDQVLTLPATSTTLTGAGNDPEDGNNVTYAWTQVKGPNNAIINAPDRQTTTVSNLLEGLYTFRLQVTDTKGAKTTDDMNVTVKAVLVNQAPTVDAGPDQTIVLPTKSITLTGSATVKDGVITSYLWERISGPNTKLTKQNSSSLKLNNLTEGKYIFRLSATGNNGVVGFDEMVLTVQAVGSMTATSTSAIKSLTDSLSTRITAYPNPVESTINIRIEEEASHEYNIVIYDILGKVLHTNILTPTSAQLNIYPVDLSHPSYLPGGFYIIEISNPSINRKEVIKILKAR